jgi:N-methylhydantoinase B
VAKQSTGRKDADDRAPPGGGGYGDLLTRSPEPVLADVREGFVSTEAAERDYGVLLNADRRAVDEVATAQA